MKFGVAAAVGLVLAAIVSLAIVYSLSTPGWHRSSSSGTNTNETPAAGIDAQYAAAIAAVVRELPALRTFAGCVSEVVSPEPLWYGDAAASVVFDGIKVSLPQNMKMQLSPEGAPGRLFHATGEEYYVRFFQREADSGFVYDIVNFTSRHFATYSKAKNNLLQSLRAEVGDDQANEFAVALDRAESRAATLPLRTVVELLEQYCSTTLQQPLDDIVAAAAERWMWRTVASIAMHRTSTVPSSLLVYKSANMLLVVMQNGASAEDEYVEERVYIEWLNEGNEWYGMCHRSAPYSHTVLHSVRLDVVRYLVDAFRDQ
jgi:hypothetical protein